MRRSFLLLLLAGFCGGVVLAEIWRATAVWLAILAVAGGLGIGWQRTRWFGLTVLALSIGMARWQAWLAPNPHNIPVRDVRIHFSGTVIDVPLHRDQQQEVELVDIQTSGRRWTGKITAWLPEYPAVRVGDRLEADCRLKPYAENTRRRHQMHGRVGYCGTIDVIGVTEADPGPRVVLGRIKAWVIKRLTDRFPEPQASLLIGILLGRQVPMPADVEASFRATGTSHIVALSGFNVTMIITALSAALVRLIGQRWSWPPVLFFVTVFIVMTGASASVTRAGVMAVVVLMAKRIGRPVSMLRLLGYALVAMVWHNPLILVHDLGFQLSFLATIGLVYAAPAIHARLPIAPAAFSIRDNLATTLGAMVMTEPLLLWHFARVSLVAPIVNVLVLPLIPLTMAAGSVALAWPSLWPGADAALRAVLGIIVWGANAPFAQQAVGGSAAGLIAAVVAGTAIVAIIRTHAINRRSH